MSDRPDAETSDNTQWQQERDIHASGGIRTRDLRKQAAEKNRNLDRSATGAHCRKHRR
jgi:hypothetical protein